MFENLKPELSAPAAVPDEPCAPGTPASRLPDGQAAGNSAGSGDEAVPAPGCAPGAPAEPDKGADKGEEAVLAVQNALAAAGSLADEPVEPPARDDTELAGWKAALRWDFERWLASVDEIPEDGFEEAGPAPPDLYSFYAQLAAANAESRKANRRTAEAISQWGETLSRFDTSLAPLRETISQLTLAQAKEGKEGQMSRTHCLALVELLDRLERIAKAFLLNARPAAPDLVGRRRRRGLVQGLGLPTPGLCHCREPPRRITLQRRRRPL